MPFNPFTWNNSQPSPTQNISTGQATILNDIQFLGSATGNVFPGFVQLPSGLIIQWGKTPALSPSSAGVDTSVALTFAGGGPTGCSMQSFPTNCFAIFFQMRATQVTNKNVVAVDTTGGTLTNAGFSIVLSQAMSGGVYVLAIGN